VAVGGAGEELSGRQVLNRWQTGKGLLVAAVVVVLFFTSIPRELTALVAAGWLLCSRRMKSRSLLGLVDWHLITLFCGLFIVIAGLQATGLPARAVEAMSAHGCDLRNLHALSGVTVLLSNLVSNVPATMLLVKFADSARPETGYVLALASTYAGNLITIGSIANLIVIEQAKTCGVRIGFREHARAGIPVTLFTLLVLALWILLCG
jgi:Na+/H+ antiporter NhaD/arsenite permease-like protein